MAVNWQVRGVSDGAIDEIKRRAKNRGLSIGQYLDWHFTNDVESIKYDSSKTNKEYKLTIDTQAMNRLKLLAAGKGFGVAKYLDEVVSNS